MDALKQKWFAEEMLQIGIIVGTIALLLFNDRGPWWIWAGLCILAVLAIDFWGRLTDPR